MKAAISVDSSVERHLSLVIDAAVPQGVREGCERFHDNLLAGPCRGDFDEHLVARASYFGGGESDWRNLYAGLDRIRGAKTIYVWSIESWVQRIALAFLCAHRARWFDGANVVICDLPSRSLGVGIGCRVPANVPAETIRRPLTGKQLEEGAAYWCAYTSYDPESVVARAGWSLLPDRRGLARFLLSLFPRELDGRKQRLSVVDESLLRSASDDWISPVDVFSSNSRASLPARRWARCAGDAMLARRLGAWSEYPLGDPALEVTKDDSSPTFLSRYRLTSKGRSLLEGLPNLREAPPFVVGGAYAYDIERPFCVRS